ncbi:hypothetical protein, partial [Terrabacter aeriphilus]|uniref:hypothetical protein n=1 Tax=Terrabacter aeriphilus TaxID=515662 RepID=UPI0031EE0EB1
MARESETLELLRSRLAALEADQHSRAADAPSPFWTGMTVGVPAPSPAATASTATDTDATTNTTSAPQGKPEPRAHQRARQIAPEIRPVQRGHGPFSDVPLERLQNVESLEDLGEPVTSNLGQGRGQGLGPGGFEAMVDDPDWLRAMDAYADHRAEQIARGTY